MVRDKCHLMHQVPVYGSVIFLIKTLDWDPTTWVESVFRWHTLVRFAQNFFVSLDNLYTLYGIHPPTEYDYDYWIGTNSNSDSCSISFVIFKRKPPYFTFISPIFFLAISAICLYLCGHPFATFTTYQQPATTAFAPGWSAPAKLICIVNFHLQIHATMALFHSIYMQFSCKRTLGRVWKCGHLFAPLVVIITHMFTDSQPASQTTHLPSHSPFDGVDYDDENDIIFITIIVIIIAHKMLCTLLQFERFYVRSWSAAQSTTSSSSSCKYPDWDA